MCELGFANRISNSYEDVDGLVVSVLLGALLHDDFHEFLFYPAFLKSTLILFQCYLHLALKVTDV